MIDHKPRGLNHKRDLVFECPLKLSKFRQPQVTVNIIESSIIQVCSSDYCMTELISHFTGAPFAE